MIQCGVLAISPISGAVLAWVGGDDYSFYKFDHVTGIRQAGSTFKPIVYAAALEEGIDPCRLYSAKQETYREFDSWAPENHDDNYDGYYSLQGALVHSVNTVSVKILMETGIDKSCDLASRLGITSSLPESPSLVLGSAGVSLLELTAAYTAFLNEGKPVMPYMIENITDRNGKVIYKAIHQQNPIPAMAPSTAETMLGILEAAVDRGTAAALRNKWNLKGSLAGKTGTSQEMADGWFIGMTPSLVMGVWVGGDNPVVRFRSGTMGYGAGSALPVFARILQLMNREPDLKKFIEGEFNISENTLKLLGCEDYFDRRGWRINAKPQPKEPVVRSSPPPTHQEKKKDSRARKFLKKIFDKKER
jgi:penicillin-binding protein 1A